VVMVSEFMVSTSCFTGWNVRRARSRHTSPASRWQQPSVQVHGVRAQLRLFSAHHTETENAPRNRAPRFGLGLDQFVREVHQRFGL
jgi:hypothetical protein